MYFDPVHPPPSQSFTIRFADDGVRFTPNHVNAGTQRMELYDRPPDPRIFLIISLIIHRTYLRRNGQIQAKGRRELYFAYKQILKSAQNGIRSVQYRFRTLANLV